jgi:Zn-dependent protease with chaperone function
MLTVAVGAGIVPAPSAFSPPASTSADYGTGSTFLDAAANRADDRLESYSRLRNVWRFVWFGAEAGALAVIVFTGLGAWLRRRTERIPKSFFALWAFVALVLILDYVLKLPFTIYRGYYVESAFGFLNQSFPAWFGRSLLRLGLLALAAIVPAGLLYWAIRRFRRWWPVFTATTAPVIVLLVVLAPVLISPLFNDFETLSDPVLRPRIVALAERAGIADAAIYEVNASAQSSKVNAYVTGLFGSKRIVIYDTMLDRFTVDEIVFIAAHEMGHYVMNHVWWGVAVAIVYVGLLAWLMALIVPWLIRRWQHRIGFSELRDYASLPLILLTATVLNFVLQPLAHIPSRVMERQADAYAVRMAEVPSDAMVTGYHKLSEINLSDPSPHPAIVFWFYTHPPLQDRIEAVQVSGCGALSATS